MTNPFTLTFGKTPNEYISRIYITEHIINTFTSDNPVSQIYMLTGIRGSGKTVMLTKVANELSSDDEWIVVSLNPERDLLTSLAAKLYDNHISKPFFSDASFGFSFAGISATIKEGHHIVDIESTLEIMLKEIKRNGKKLLITIDEVTNNKHIRIFSSAFQILLREDLPVFLLMTGLFENIHNLENEKSLTFLYRAPKITLEPLSLSSIELSYQRIFQISSEKAIEMAKLTHGYAFAYQVLGYLLWESETHELSDSIIHMYDRYLEEYVYEKIWSQLSGNDRIVIWAIADSVSYQISDILKLSGMKKNALSVYRDRLNKKGLVDISQRGSMRLNLPRFAEFALKKREYEFI